MHETELRALHERVARLEAEAGARTWTERYARVYAPMAVLSLMLVFMPILETVVVKDGDGAVTYTAEYGNLLQMATRTGGEPALVALFLVLGFVALLLAATFGVWSRAVPWGIVTLAVLLLLMLLTKPGTGTPTPDLAAAGLAGVGLAVAAILIGTLHGTGMLERLAAVQPSPPAPQPPQAPQPPPSAPYPPPPAAPPTRG